MAKLSKGIDYDEIVANIRKYPDVATEIGIFIAAYAGLELALWHVFAQVLGREDPNASVDLLGHIQSFSLRLDAIERFLPHSPDKKKLEKTAADIISKARDINKFRIDLVHGLYFKRSTGGLLVHTSLTDPSKGKGRAMHIRAEIIKAKSDETLQLVGRIAKEFTNGFLHFDFAMHEDTSRGTSRRRRAPA
jgi:hypothetical protein